MRDRPEKALAHRIPSAQAQTANNLRLKANGIIERFSTISQSRITAKATNAQAHQLQAMIAAQTWQAADAAILQIVCHKSGRVIGHQSLETITALIAAHGEERARELLAFAWCNQTAIEWQATDPQALKGLIIADPIGYLVYAAGLIFSPIAVAKSGTMTTPHDIYSEETNNSPLPVASIATMPVSQQCKFHAVKDRAIANQQAQALPLELVIEMNQLMSRMWGLISPHELLRNHEFRRGRSLAYYTSNPLALMQLREMITNVLRRLAEKKIGERITKTDHRYVSFAEICEIQGDSHGMAAFRMMQVRKPKTSIDPDILACLQDFTMDTIWEGANGASANMVKPTIARVSKAATTTITLKPAVPAPAPAAQPQAKLSQPLSLAALLAKTKEGNKQ